VEHNFATRDATFLRKAVFVSPLILTSPVQIAEEYLFPEVESLATRMKGLALNGEDLFYSFFGYV
jgi:hypothetical protein